MDSDETTRLREWFSEQMAEIRTHPTCPQRWAVSNAHAALPRGLRGLRHVHAARNNRHIAGIHRGFMYRRYMPPISPTYRSLLHTPPLPLISSPHSHQVA
jgi:hypothetical protein